MKINSKQIIYLKEISSPFYDELKVEFLFHSNKLEGSTFDEEQLITLLTESKVQGEHSIDDVQETINSLKLLLSRSNFFCKFWNFSVYCAILFFIFEKDTI